jgi:hypothetical protein
MVIFTGRLTNIIPKKIHSATPPNGGPLSDVNTVGQSGKPVKAVGVWLTDWETDAVFL